VHVLCTTLVGRYLFADSPGLFAGGAAAGWLLLAVACCCLVAAAAAPPLLLFMLPLQHWTF